MTEHDAKTIEQAAILLLHAVNNWTANAHVRAALKNLPADGPVSLRAARGLLEGHQGVGRGEDRGLRHDEF